MLLEIKINPDEILRRTAKNIPAGGFNGEVIRHLAADMIETMYAKDGVGLAAPQAGKSIRLCVIAKNFTADQKKDLILINPKWEKAGILREWGDEGCLSVPDIYGQVKRYRKIKVEALDENGKPLKFLAENFFARIVQHEIDHLNGILFIDKAKGLHTVAKEKL